MKPRANSNSAAILRPFTRSQSPQADLPQRLRAIETSLGRPRQRPVEDR